MELLYYQLLHAVRHDRLPIEMDEAVSILANINSLGHSFDGYEVLFERWNYTAVYKQTQFLDDALTRARRR